MRDLVHIQGLQGERRAKIGGRGVSDVIDFDHSADPVIAVASPGHTIIAAQNWVLQHKTPMIVLDGGLQYVLLYENASGSITLEPFYRVTDPGQAAADARAVLKRVSEF